MAYRIGIDTGGTFTGVVALDGASGAVVTTKTSTTPADPSIGFMQGVQKIARVAGFELEAVSHGTTVATRALLQETYSGLALVVTRGFGTLLEIARQSVPFSYARQRSSSCRRRNAALVLAGFKLQSP